MRKLNQKSAPLVGFVQGGLVASYVLLLVNVMSRFEHWGQNAPEALLGSFMLLTFVFSALFCASVVLLYPVLLLLDGKIKRALTVMAFSALTIIAVLAIVLIAILV